MDRTTTTTPAPATTTTTQAPRVQRAAAATVAAVAEPRGARLYPPGPWTRAAAAEALTPDELLQVRATVEPHAEQVLLWAQNGIQPEGVDVAGFRATWGEAVAHLNDKQIRTIMRAIAEHAGGEFVPGESA